eukprot:scaffold2987_cov170-Amphora_coffeaeformis.AAC.8
MKGSLGMQINDLGRRMLGTIFPQSLQRFGFVARRQMLAQHRGRVCGDVLTNGGQIHGAVQMWHQEGQLFVDQFFHVGNLLRTSDKGIVKNGNAGVSFFFFLGRDHNGRELLLLILPRTYHVDIHQVHGQQQTKSNET